MFHLKGHCHCGNIQVEAAVSEPPDLISPRTCDCDFCEQHGASYISDGRGKLHFRFQDPSRIGRYRQGSSQAEFLLCQICGALAGVIYQEENNIYAALNCRILGNQNQFSPPQTVSPKVLSAEAKAKRWKEVWFHDVQID